MTTGRSEPARTRAILTQVQKHMDVFDVNGDKVGVVEDMYFGADVDDPQAHGAGARTTGTPPTVADGGLVGHVMRSVFGDDDLPETLRNRLLNDGYVRIDPGTLLGGDMYATPDLIASVSGDGVRLNVTGDKLIRP